MNGPTDLALGPLDREPRAVDLRRDALGERNRPLADARHDASYQTTASNSPPTRAVRTRVSISATGSVTLISSFRPLPAGLAHAGNLPAQRQVAETNAAQAELPQRAPAATAALAAVIAADLELRLPFHLFDPRLLRHPSPPRPRPELRPGTACPSPGAAPEQHRRGRQS